MNESLPDELESDIAPLKPNDGSASENISKDPDAAEGADSLSAADVSFRPTDGKGQIPAEDGWFHSAESASSGFAEGTLSSPYIDSSISSEAFAPEVYSSADSAEGSAAAVSPIHDRIASTEAPLFAQYGHYPSPPAQRIPNFAHLLVFVLMIIGSFLCSSFLFLAALHYHLGGISTADQAKDNIDYTLGSEAAIYLITIAGCVGVFPLIWRRGFFAGLQWRGATALRLRWRLVGAALVCFALAMVNELLIPGPVDTPIDRVFRLPGAAWLLFAFGVTLAPLFEEIAYRGFVLPALCTAYDWIAEHIAGRIAPQNDENGHPLWSIPAMVVSSVIASIPFALMHGEQTAWSVGPFLLLVCVSLVLCWVRLATRSLAASVMVHSCYNFILFSLMLAVTGGFRHLDKM